MLKARRKFKFTSESQLAEAIVSWLESQGWVVYKEVKPKRLDGIADIVAIKDDKMWVIETKLNYGTKVLEQAHRWQKYADFVSVAVPKTNQKNIVLDFFSQEKGIGIFWVTGVEGNMYVHTHKNPKLNQNLLKQVITESLREEQKASVAGAVGGGYITPYKITIDNIKKLLQEKGPLTIQNIVDSIQHHYASRASAIQTLNKRLFDVEKDFETVIEFDRVKIKLKSQ